MTREPSTWNYVIVKDGKLFGVHEQYSGRGCGSITVDPIRLDQEESVHSLWVTLARIAKDCNQMPILEWKNGKLRKYRGGNQRV